MFHTLLCSCLTLLLYSIAIQQVTSMRGRDVDQILTPGVRCVWMWHVMITVINGTDYVLYRPLSVTENWLQNYRPGMW